MDRDLEDRDQEDRMDQEDHRVVDLMDQEDRQSDREVLAYWVVDQGHPELQVDQASSVHLEGRTDLESMIVLVWTGTGKNRRRKTRKVLRKTAKMTST